MTAEEIIDFFAPSSSTTDAITEWLVASGISADRFALSVNKQVLPLPAWSEKTLTLGAKTNFPHSSGFNLMQQLLKLKNSSLQTFISGSILREPKTFPVKSIMCQPIFKSISTTSLQVPDSGKGIPRRHGLTSLPNASALVLSPSLPSFPLFQIPMPPTAIFM